MDTAEAEKLVREGWKPYKRRYRDRLNISLRKANKEKTLGPYSEDLWNHLNRIAQSGVPQTRATRIYEEVMRRLKHVRAFQMSRDCVHVDEGYCTFWRYEEERVRDIAPLAPRPCPGDPRKAELNAVPLSCADCPAYMRKPI